MVVIATILLTAVITGLAVYIWQRPINERVIGGLKKTSLEGQISMLNNEKITQQQDAPSVISNWKTYANGKYKFAIDYPG